MAGYNGVQAHKPHINRFVPCPSYSWNLVGVHVSAVNSTMKTFIANVQKTELFFKFY